MKWEFLQGNEACAVGAFTAGARFFAGYPITPASELAEYCSRELPKIGGTYVQMEDEIGSIASVIGASLGGLKAFTATSGPGMSLMQENLGFASMAEVPCVIINVQRYGPSTGVATRPGQGDVMQARWGTHGDHSIIALAPATVQECFDLTVEAFNLSERFSTPVIILSDATIAHLREKIAVKEPSELKIIPRGKPTGPPEDYLPYRPGKNGVPTLSAYGSPYILRVTGLVHDSAGYSTNKPELCDQLIKRLESKIIDYQDELPPANYFGPQNPETLIIAYGSPSRAAREAASRAAANAHRIGVLQLVTLWPFPEETVLRRADDVNTVIVVEENRGQILGEVARTVGGKSRVEALLKTDTQDITPTDVLSKITEVTR